MVPDTHQVEQTPKPVRVGGVLVPQQAGGWLPVLSTSRPILFSPRFPGHPHPSAPQLRAPGGIPQPLWARQCSHQHPHRGLCHPVGCPAPGVLSLLPQRQNLRGSSEVRQEGAAGVQTAHPSPGTLAPPSVKLLALLGRRIFRDWVTGLFELPP